MARLFGSKYGKTNRLDEKSTTKMDLGTNWPGEDVWLRFLTWIQIIR